VLLAFYAELAVTILCRTWCYHFM